MPPIRCYTNICASLAFISCSQSFAPSMYTSHVVVIESTSINQQQYYTSSSSYSTLLTASIIDDIPDGVEWIPLVDTPDDTDEMPPVVIHSLTEGEEGYMPTRGATVELQHTGTLLENDWSTNDVIECWLSNLQGLDHLSSMFIEKQIDSSILMDEAIFTEEYCMNELEISNKIQAKKLIMAARRLAKQKEDYPQGMEFDSSISRNKNYAFTLGQGKAIKAIELAVSKMKVGERVVVICRSDYGYGSEGLRTSKGDVIVPPFATLCFDLTLVSATS